MSVPEMHCIVLLAVYCYVRVHLGLAGLRWVIGCPLVRSPQQCNEFGTPGGTDFSRNGQESHQPFIVFELWSDSKCVDPSLRFKTASPPGQVENVREDGRGVCLFCEASTNSE